MGKWTYAQVDNQHEYVTNFNNRTTLCFTLHVKYLPTCLRFKPREASQIAKGILSQFIWSQ